MHLAVRGEKPSAGPGARAGIGSGAPRQSPLPLAAVGDVGLVPRKAPHPGGTSTMVVDGMYEFRNYLQSQGIMFCYSGYVTEEILSGIGEALKRKMALDEADTKTTRGVFSVFVEQMQNVIRYSAEIEAKEGEQRNLEMRYGVLTVGKTDGRFFVTCGNLVRKDDVDRLEGALQEIQTMDKSQLKDLYKRKLRGPTPEGSKGAGVGFIDIARRASGPINFSFEDVAEKHAFFTLKAFV